MKPSIETITGLYAAAVKLGSPTALERIKECIERHGYNEDQIKWLAALAYECSE